ncbi:sigma-70 family RNA polymerase sigma factor [Paenibacillus sp. SN-8-1]|uniref:sigma-70 family RNA polymerase sigma factor n=1 Tax=Paenibacillus sp. SN-8-1 TaxID=3435409 RepID=UPI003D9A9A17
MTQTDYDESLVLDNLKLVNYAIRKIWPAVKGGIFSYEDLVSEGTIGLIQAAKRFDPNKGYSFTTFAVQVISGHVKRYVDNNGKTIRYPIHITTAAIKLAKLGFTGTEPVEAAAEELNCTRFIAQLTLNCIRDRKLLSTDYNETSDSQEGDYSFSRFASMTQDYSGLLVSDFLDKLRPTYKEVVNEVMKGLSLREIAVKLGYSKMTVFNRLNAARYYFDMYCKGEKLPSIKNQVENARTRDSRFRTREAVVHAANG